MHLVLIHHCFGIVSLQYSVAQGVRKSKNCRFMKKTHSIVPTMKIITILIPVSSLKTHSARLYPSLYYENQDSAEIPEDYDYSRISCQ